MQLEEWSSGLGKHIVKVEDGKSVIGNFRGEIVRFYQHWPKGGRSSICPGRETCPLCNSQDEGARKASGRFRANFITKVDGKLVPMVFEGGKRVYEQMIQLNKDLPLEKAWIRVSRTGKDTNTQYMLSFIHGEAGMVKASEEKAIQAIELHDLSLNKSEETEEEPASGDIPF